MILMLRIGKIKASKDHDNRSNVKQPPRESHDHREQDHLENTVHPAEPATMHTFAVKNGSNNYFSL